MRRVIVEVITDHDDSEEAARSVQNAMVRAGYNHDNTEAVTTGSHFVTCIQSLARDAMFGGCAAMMRVKEPEVDD